MTNIRKEFDVHMLNSEGKYKARLLAEKFSILLSEVEDICGTDGREMAIVRTKLEETSFFAKKAMAINPLHQE